VLLTRRMLRFRRMSWMVLYLALYPAMAVLERLFLAMARYRTLEGIRVGVLDRSMAPQSWSKVGAALDLVKRATPRWFARSLRDLDAILVLPVRSRLLVSTHTCVLSQQLVAERSPVIVASEFVHEAIHARLQRRGLRWSPDVRGRHESVCLAAEIAFISRLPSLGYQGAERHIEFLEQRRRCHESRGR
jgi:hypothetical protein